MIMKKNSGLLEILGALIGGVVALLLFIGVIWGFTHFDLFYQQVFAPKYADIKRETFEHSKSYVHGMVNDLSDYKREYERTSDPDEKEQILNYIDSHFANFDAELIDNSTLYKFLLDVRNGNLK